MTEYHKKKKFLKLPKYPGGSEAFRKFIAKNLQYPDTALEARIEGSVFVEYVISDNGLVSELRILKGIGYGCDEEALRLVGMLRYEKVKNQGVRVKTTTKTTIHFRLPASMTISYTSSPKNPPEKKNDNPETYNYTITF
jgi:TonB family protein